MCGLIVGTGLNSLIQVWPPEGKKKFETLSYLPTLSYEELSREVDYLLRSGWIPCLEFCKVCNPQTAMPTGYNNLGLSLIN